jgi:hypothetical protein
LLTLFIVESSPEVEWPGNFTVAGGSGLSNDAYACGTPVS